MHNGNIAQDPASILLALQIRLNQLPKESWNYVAILLASHDLIPSPLSETLLAMILSQHTPVIGPLHEAVATTVILRGFNDSRSAALRQQNQALIFACHGDKAALDAIEFIIELPSLIEPDN